VDRLHPVQLADSTQVKVGELAIAIGNPFGLESTMTVGIVSALERTLSADVTNSLGPVYSIPDIIQTDAPINPGNSGGVLVNAEGQVMGVTAAIESSVNSNAGIGFAIPSALVAKVVPALIKDQHYAHPYLGITGATLTLGLAQAMDLPVGQRGALVVSVVPQGPADQAGLRGSDKTATLDGQSVTIGGDVITAINGQPIAKMDDLIAYLADQTEVGQSVTLTVLRGGQAISLKATLAARPAQTETSAARADETQKGAWLGILGADLTPAVAQAMDLDKAQTGILIQQIEAGSPADKAGLQGSTKSVTINGQRLAVGGDIITAIDGQPVTRLAELQQVLQTHKAGAEVQLTILRAGATTTISVTLAERSAP
jgi:S1-C subfamily serine protease